MVQTSSYVTEVGQESGGQLDRYQVPLFVAIQSAHADA